MMDTNFRNHVLLDFHPLYEFAYKKGLLTQPIVDELLNLITSTEKRALLLNLINQNGKADTEDKYKLD